MGYKNRCFQKCDFNIPILIKVVCSLLLATAVTWILPGASCWLQWLMDPGVAASKLKNHPSSSNVAKKIQHARHKNYHQQCLSWQKISNINFSVKKNIKQNFFCEFKCIILSTNTAWHTNNNFNNVCQCLPVGF